MDIELRPIEVRVLGCLIEKEIATPEYYPLTLNALVNACNQKSNRSPVMELDEAAVTQALYELRMTHHLAVEVTSTGTRVPKYRHALLSQWSFSPAQMAVLCELFVRGAQTAGDLRAHASRLHPLADSEEAETVLQELEQHGQGPFVVQLPREPGRRERRWAHLFSGIQDTTGTADALPEAVQANGPTTGERLHALEAQAAALRSELEELRSAFNEFKTAFE